MPKGIYKKSKEHMAKFIEIGKATRFTKDTPTTFKKGNVPWIKGREQSEEHRKGIGDANRGENNGMYGRELSTTHKHKISLAVDRMWETRDRTVPEVLRIKMSLAKTGEEEFTGFKQKYSKRLRNSSRWKKWRTKVFERDNYTCLDCSKKGVFLHPHHIVPVAECLAIDFEELIFDVDNGNTLCAKCHRGIHFKGGG